MLNLVTSSITHVSFSTSGGPGITAKNLSFYQNKMGFESKFISNIDMTLANQPFLYPWLTSASLIDEFIVGFIYLKYLMKLNLDHFV